MGLLVLADALVGAQVRLDEEFFGAVRALERLCMFTLEIVTTDDAHEWTRSSPSTDSLATVMYWHAHDSFI